MTNNDIVKMHDVIRAIEKCLKKCYREDQMGDKWIHYETALNEIKCISPVIAPSDDVVDRKILLDEATKDGAYGYISVAEIEQLPSAEHKIVRCRDCREFRRYIDTDITFCDYTEVEVKDDDFCSHAKKGGA